MDTSVPESARAGLSVAAALAGPGDVTRVTPSPYGSCHESELSSDPRDYRAELPPWVRGGEAHLREGMHYTYRR
jgi:hypothetical protein